MNIVIWIVIGIVVCYSLGFAFTLWKENSKIGAFTMIAMAVAIIVSPFFSILR
ncbi:hypothetical protein SAMN05216389_10847 [Oceanobacillus limi]|uniref:Uncharacterized protein n=1 Tax=Oceanobacillus limi TaxID=930131 RepID=A0A1I0D715_9BACI|nr:hypothetical protein [Oceanobacillus limi]SET28033.1 hypothetical protein SAMN05216389_10847 [Oceanobacillus limi]